MTSADSGVGEAYDGLTGDVDRYQGKTLRMVVESEQRVAIRSALDRNKTVSATARELGISKQWLWALMKRFRIETNRPHYSSLRS